MLKEKILISIFIILLGATARIFMVEFVQVPNFEAITALSLIAGAFLGGIFVLIVPLSIISISDIYLGNSSILIFTWSAFIIIGFLGWLLRKRKSLKCHFVAQMTVMGVVSSLFFFLYTNFGWWLLTNMYPLTFAGLIHCYAAALPFLKTNLLGNFFFVPVFVSLALISQSVIFKSNSLFKILLEQKGGL